MRKLEFILGEVKKRNKKRVVTLGGIGTNHGLATAVFCQKLGIDCTLFLLDQPVTKNVKQNLLLFNKYNAKIIYKKTILKTFLSYFVTHRVFNPFDYYLFVGGSNIFGTIGYVNAAFELKSQIELGLMPEPSKIICPVGSNGTIAGLCLGIMLSGLKTEVIGIRVTPSQVGPFQACTSKTVFDLMEKTYRFLKIRSPNIPEVKMTQPELSGDYFGNGYGHPTKKGGEAYRLLKEKEDIILDPCYTSKTFAAVLDYCNRQRNDSGPVLYWHTYNSVDLSKQTASIDYHVFPPEIQKFFETTETTY